MKFFIQKIALILVFTSGNLLTTASAEGGDEYPHLEEQTQTVDAPPNSNESPIHPTLDKMIELLGKEITGILSSPESVQAYRIEFEPKAETPALQTLSGFRVHGEGVALNEAQIKHLQSAILNYTNYNFEFAEKCGFYPHIGFSFRQANEPVDLLLDMNCKKWQFSYQDKSVNGSYYAEVMPALMDLYKQLFVSDKKPD